MRTLYVLFVPLPFLPDIFPHHKTALSLYDIPQFSMLLLNLNIGNAVADIKTTGIEELTGIIEKDIQWMQVPPGVTVTITGNPVVYIEVLGALTDGRILMTYLGLFLVLGGLLVVYRDWLKALAAIIPMFIVTGWSGLVMKFLGILYTPMTATMGALIIGIGCEYSVLMMWARFFWQLPAQTYGKK